MGETFRKSAENDMILIAGPTASGKSQLGIDIAQQCHGIVINVDSMQVYNVLRTLTAQPDRNMTIAIPHFLYAFVKPDLAFSTWSWFTAVHNLLQHPDIAGRTCVFVGGTGLYFRALLGGLARIPPIDSEIRTKWRSFLQREGVKPLYGILLERDPILAERFSPNDGQRMIRALEVLESTGHSIRDWQKEHTWKPLLNTNRTRKLVIEPEKDWLSMHINIRFDTMIEKGVLDEVRQLRIMHLDPSLPVMKAIGVRELSAYLDGQTSLEAAIEKAKTATRHYAKRQMTWLRHQLDADWQRFPSVETVLRSFA